ncbi:MAG: nucleoside deaminase [Myxococcales bacterium FL481]|nr:MAG: nucleoside deaminase [Myxococcales bacterium FL481]
MGEALRVARRAGARGDVPVGAIVVRSDAIIGVGFNTRERDDDPSGHAEVVALRDACRQARRWRLDGATLFVTLEPCPMCAGALVNARVARLVYGATDPKGGAVTSLFEICDDPRLNHRLDVRGGVLASDCAALLRDFFAQARRRGDSRGWRQRRATIQRSVRDFGQDDRSRSIAEPAAKKGSSAS